MLTWMYRSPGLTCAQGRAGVSLHGCAAGRSWELALCWPATRPMSITQACLQGLRPVPCTPPEGLVRGQHLHGRLAEALQPGAVPGEVQLKAARLRQLCQVQPAPRRRSRVLAGQCWTMAGLPGQADHQAAVVMVLQASAVWLFPFGVPGRACCMHRPSWSTTAPPACCRWTHSQFACSGAGRCTLDSRPAAAQHLAAAGGTPPLWQLGVVHRLQRILALALHRAQSSGWPSARAVRCKRCMAVPCGTQEQT